MSEQLVAAAMECLVEVSAECPVQSAGTAGDDSIERLREDAERYRWLRQQQAINCWPQVVDGLYRLAGDEMDAAVDEAMYAARGIRVSVSGRTILN